MAPVLVLVPAFALAQMGSDRGMGPGVGSMMQRSEKSEEPRKPSPLPAQRPPSGAGMTGEQMQHPAPTSPFYRERTFLVLVGAGAAVGGFLIYRVTRSRWRRRGPATFVTEAVLVVDLVDSTRLATHYGDGVAMRARTVVRDRTLTLAEQHGHAFAESTGDGYLMTFPSVAGAVATVISLLRDLRDRPPDLAPGPAIEVRAGISYGEILLDGRGIRHSAVINRAFRLEALRREDFAQVDAGVAPGDIPDRNRIFLDEEAAQEAEAGGIPLRVVGYSGLKGFSGLHRVYEAVWEKGEER